MGPTSRQRKPDSKLPGYRPVGLICCAKTACPSKATRNGGVRNTNQRHRFIMAIECDLVAVDFIGRARPANRDTLALELRRPAARPLAAAEPLSNHTGR